jgi:hypothetical protein
MAQQLRILQSLWAMERRRADEAEWPLQTQLAMIRDAGFDGAGVRFIDPAFAKEVTDFLRTNKMIWQAQCYPTDVDDLKPVLELRGADWRRPRQLAAQRTAAAAGSLHSLAGGLAPARRAGRRRRACRNPSRPHDDGPVFHAATAGLLSRLEANR